MPRELQGAPIPSLILNIQDNRPQMWGGFFNGFSRPKIFLFLRRSCIPNNSTMDISVVFIKAKKIIHQRYIPYNGARRNMLK